MSDFSFGDALRVTVFGQSHAPAVGCVIEGYPAGERIDWDAVRAFMQRRAPGRDALSTPRRESDLPNVVSGLNGEGLTCGAPITAIIENTNVRSSDYDLLKDVPRPGHADLTALFKYGSAADLRGGGPFSARLTAPIVFAGALALQYLQKKGVRVAAHIASIGDVEDVSPDPVCPTLPMYGPDDFPVIDRAAGERMKALILSCKQEGDSVGGVVRLIAAGLPQGLGGPLFGGLEGRLSMAMFAIPAVKGVAFGEGFDASRMTGSAHNDPYCVKDGRPVPLTNHAGGLLGGITTGLPIRMTVAFKPTPSIAREQKSVSLAALRECPLSVPGRHDPCVVPRAVPVVEAMAALTLCDVMLKGA